MTKKTLCILGCSKSKNNGTMKAYKLYDKSSLFRLSTEFCEVNNYDFVIISAKFGVLHPNNVIKNYDENFNHKSKIAEMSKPITLKLEKIIKDYDKIIILCGMNYIKTFRTLVNKKFSFPLKGMGIGVRMHWLKNKTNKKIK